MDLMEAKALALAFAQKDFYLSELGDVVDIIDSKTVEVPSGWVFSITRRNSLRPRIFP